MFYRNPYIKKPDGAIWSDKSEASIILNNEFFGVEGVPTTTFGKIKVGGVLTSITGKNVKIGGVVTSVVQSYIKSGGSLVAIS